MFQINQKLDEEEVKNVENQDEQISNLNGEMGMDELYDWHSHGNKQHIPHEDCKNESFNTSAKIGLIQGPKMGTKELYQGPQGGEYYWNANGNKQYVPREEHKTETINWDTHIGYKQGPKMGTKELYQGPKGGEYYWNANGNKQYVPHEEHKTETINWDTHIGYKQGPKMGSKELYQGPRGGQYYLNAQGNKQYVSSETKLKKTKWTPSLTTSYGIVGPRTGTKGGVYCYTSIDNKQCARQR